MKCRLAALALLFGGCVSVPKLLPASPQPGGKTDIEQQVDGVWVRVVPNAWRGPPDALAENFTPLWIHLVNRGEQAYDITFANVSLTDEQGRLYAVVPPGEVVRAVLGSAAPQVGPVRVASAEVASDVGSPLLAQFGFGFGIGPAYDPFDPLANPYGPYGPYGYAPSYADAARNIVAQALREGRLLPRTQAMGFLYFQPAYPAHLLHLRIQAAPEAVGAPPLDLEAEFAVSR